MKKLISILLCALFCVGLASCGKDSPDETTVKNETAVSEQEPDETAESTTEEVTYENYSISIGYTEADKIGDAIYYENSDADYSVYLKITFNQPVTDFTFMDVTGEIDEEGAMIITAGKTIGEKSDVPMGKAVVIRTEMPETVPFNAIKLNAADGTEYRYYITMSGENGSPILTGW